MQQERKGKELKQSMDEITGLLKVRVIKGCKLAIRDFRSSDPYVVLKLGLQIAKTRVIKSNLNPVWDEELTFSLTATTTRLLKLQVFDKDTFTADDEMGDAEVDLKALQSSVRMQSVLNSRANRPEEEERSARAAGAVTPIRKLVPSQHNCLAKESCIRLVEGIMTQDLCLRLRNVESGVIELQLKWIDCSQQ